MASPEPIRKVKIEVEEDIALAINSMKERVGETYSDVLRRKLNLKR